MVLATKPTHFKQGLCWLMNVYFHNIMRLGGGRCGVEMNDVMIMSVLGCPQRQSETSCFSKFWLPKLCHHQSSRHLRCRILPGAKHHSDTCQLFLNIINRASVPPVPPPHAQTTKLCATFLLPRGARGSWAMRSLELDTINLKLVIIFVKIRTGLKYSNHT